MKKKDITDAWARIRKIDQTIPDEVLDFMKNAALRELELLNKIDELKLRTTQRGFAIGEFKDRNGVKCSIQQSSIATEDCIWLGIMEHNPIIMASQAAQFGIISDETTGWVPYPVPNEVQMNDRMHLTKEHVKNLLPHLIRFAETGDI